MPWLILLGAGIVEVAWALSLKPTEGFTRLWPTVLSLVLMCGAVYLLTIAVRTLPIGTAYAVFTGIGAVGTVVIGIMFAGDPPTLARIGPIALIVAGVVLLRVLADG
ncbi:MAG: multidrug efflux SMR transporter [Kibdelosporangium sp.]